MGYRHYFYKVNKSEVENIKNMDMVTLCEYARAHGVEMYDEEDGGGFYFNDDKFMGKTEIFEFGKLYFEDTAERIYKKGQPLFSRKEVQEEFDDYVPYVVGKDGLLEAISVYEEKINKYYNGLLAGEEGDSEEAALEHIKSKNRRFSMSSLVNTNEDNKWCVTGSWEYEHSIFNLVHILKTIDWEHETILFYGW